MYQSEALWINFSGSYPCAIKIAAGKINAVSGQGWSNDLSCDPQDYLVVPHQPWLDGFNVSEGYIRQFVAMPLGAGYTAEEQVTGKAEVGGLQIIAYPMKAALYEELRSSNVFIPDLCYTSPSESFSDTEMGLAPGGLMKQEISEDPYGLKAWDMTEGLRCFVHLANSQQYEVITGKRPPQPTVTAEDYEAAGLPWFDYYSDLKAVGGSKVLAGLSSVAAKTIEAEGKTMPGNESVTPRLVHSLRRKTTVRDGCF